MKKEIKFPLIFGGKVYYNLDEIPLDIKQILNEKLELGLELNYSHQKWETIEYEHLNLEKIQLVSNNLPENKSKNDIPEIPVKQSDTSINEVGTIEIKRNFGEAYINESQNNPHKKKFDKKDGDNNYYKLILIVLQFVIIVTLILYIFLSRK